MMFKTEDNTFASDENILSISKRLIRQNKEVYEVLANQVNPRQDQVDIAKSLFGILSKDADVEESILTNSEKEITGRKQAKEPDQSKSWSNVNFTKKKQRKNACFSGKLTDQLG